MYQLRHNSNQIVIKHLPFIKHNSVFTILSFFPFSCILIINKVVQTSKVITTTEPLFFFHKVMPIFSSLYLQPIILLIVESDFIILLNFLINGCLNYHPCFLNYYGQFFDSWTGCYFLLFIFLFRIFIIFFFYFC